MKCTMDQHDFVGEAGHDWVLVPPTHVNPKGSVEGLLWACPCSEFKLTSYSEWEKRQRAEGATTFTEVKDGAWKLE